MLASAGELTAANPTTGNPENLFGITNLYSFHLTISPDQWAVMGETEDIQESPTRRDVSEDGSGRLRSTESSGKHPQIPEPRPRAKEATNGPMPGAEFKKATAELEFQNHSFGSIRVRFKGHSSFRYARNSLKRSLKLDFNDLEIGRTFFGLTKLNLNNNAMDPSQMREALAYHIFREGGVPAGRTAFAKVFITVPDKYDHAYAGLHTIVEQVDERFLKARFGTKAGLLLKPDQLPGLPYFGAVWSAYTNRVRPKTPAATNDTAMFMDFVRFLDSAEDAQFQAEVADYVDVDEFLRFLALEALLSNMDSSLMTSQNYYLYLHPKIRRFVWVPWDLNEAFGGFGPAGSATEQANLSLDQPFTRVNRFAGRVLQKPGVMERYHEILRSLLADHFNAARIFPVIDAMAKTIRPALTDDQMVSMTQFEAALSELNVPATVGGSVINPPRASRWKPGPPVAQAGLGLLSRRSSTSVSTQRCCNWKER